MRQGKKDVAGYFNVIRSYFRKKMYATYVINSRIDRGIEKFSGQRNCSGIEKIYWTT